MTSIAAPVTTFIGAEGCPTREFVRQHVAALQGALHAARPAESDFAFAAYSNLFTHYSVMLLSCQLIQRPRVDAINVRRISALGAAFFPGKDGGSGYTERTGVFGKTGARQFAYYEEHRRRIGLFVTARGRRDPDCLATWLEADGSARVHQPIHLQLGEVPWRATSSALRRYMITALGEKGLPEEYSRAIRGHWHIGLEPHGPLSTLAPWVVWRAAEPVIAEVMAEDGWLPIRSKVGAR